jgi:hypothetical protein
LKNTIDEIDDLREWENEIDEMMDWRNGVEIIDNRQK